MCNAPATFQNYINYTFHNVLNNYYIIYLNDILIFLKTCEKYIRYINKVIRRLGEAELQININKSEFYIIKIKYLGLIILINRMIINLDKIQSL